MSEPRPIIVLLKGAPVERDRMIHLAKDISLVANELANIVDGLVLVDLDSNRRERARARSRAERLKSLSKAVEELFE